MLTPKGRVVLINSAWHMLQEHTQKGTVTLGFAPPRLSRWSTRAATSPRRDAALRPYRARNPKCPPLTFPGARPASRRSRPTWQARALGLPADSQDFPRHAALRQGPLVGIAPRGSPRKAVPPTSSCRPNIAEAMRTVRVAGAAAGVARWALAAFFAIVAGGTLGTAPTSITIRNCGLIILPSTACLEGPGAPGRRRDPSVDSSA